MTPFLLIIHGVPKKQQKNFDFRPFLETDPKSMSLTFLGDPVAPNACDVEHFAHLMRRGCFAVVKICYYVT